MVASFSLHSHSLFHMKIPASVAKSLHQDYDGPCSLHLPFLFLIHTLSCSAAKQKVLVQALTNCVHCYDHESNVHASDIMHTLKSVYSIDSSVKII